MVSKRKTLTEKLVLDNFNTSTHPLYFIGKTKMLENKKLNVFLNLQSSNPFAVQTKIKQSYPNVETRAYYPHTLLVKTR